MASLQTETKNENTISEEDVKRLEEELSKHAQRLEEAKLRLQQSKQTERVHQAQELSRRLEELEREVEEERSTRQDLRNRMQSLRMEKHNEEVDILQEITSLERDQLLEDIAFHRIQLSDIQDHRQEIERILQEQELYIDVIDFEKNRRKEQNLDDLHLLLHGTTVLRAELQNDLLDASDVIHHADVLSRHVKNINENFAQSSRSEDIMRFVDQVKSTRAIKYHEQKANRQKEIQDLNQHRIQLLQQEKLISEKKNQLKVNDEQASVENSSEKDNLDSDWEDDFDQFIERLEKDIPSKEKRIIQLKQEQQALLRQFAQQDAMYDGSLGISSYPLESLPVYKIIRALVDDLVGEVLVEHLIEPESQDQLKTLEQEASASRARDSQRLHARWLREFATEVYLQTQRQVVDNFVQQIAAEVVNWYHFTNKMADELILASVIDTFGKNDMKKPLMDAFLTMQQVHSENNLPPRLSFRTVPLTKVEESKHDYKDTPIEDPSVITIRLPNSPSYTTPQTMNAEALFGSLISVNQVCTITLPSNTSIPMHVTCMTSSPDGKKIALGTISGSLYIWHLMKDIQEQTTPVLLRCGMSASNSPIIFIVWASDSSSSLLTLNANHCLCRWHTVYSTKHLFPTQVTQSEFKPTPLFQETTIEAIDLVKPWNEEEVDIKNRKERREAEKRRKEEESLAISLSTPSYCMIHPYMTLLGEHPCFMIGTCGGSIIKWNTRGSEKLAFASIVATTEHPNPLRVSTSLSRIEREFFQGHQSRVNLILFPPASAFSNSARQCVCPMVTVDEDARIFLWDYSEDCFSGFGWFLPM